MQNLFFKKSDEDFSTSLTVDFNAETGICLLSGESFVENSREVYQPVLNWIEDYLDSDKIDLTFINKIKYFNSAFVKIIFEMLMIFKEFEKKGKIIKIEWHYNKSDSELENDIISMSIDSGMKIKHVVL